MKRIRIALALLIALVLCVPAALAAEGDVELACEGENTIYFSRCFSDGDTLYAVTEDSLYTWRPGDAELTPHPYALEAARDGTSRRILPFLCDGQLYAIALTSVYDGVHTKFEGAMLYALTPEADGSIGFQERTSVDWEDLIEYYGQESWANEPGCIVAMSGRAYMRSFRSYSDSVVSALDLDTGRLRQVDALEDIYALTGYRDGLLLAEQFSYRQSDESRLLAYDPEADSARELATLRDADFAVLNGLAYDSEADVIYCVRGGEICPVDIEAGEIGAGVTDMPMHDNSNTGCVLAGGWYACALEGVIVRSLNADETDRTRLKIWDSSYSDAVNAAYSRFAAERRDVRVVISRDYAASGNLVTGMMNQDDDVDIYTLWTSSADFDALFGRGYMMELEGPEVEALAGRMYPSLRDGLSRDGRLMAVPVDRSCWTPAVSQEALALLGLTMADVPDNWWDFLDFLKDLEGPIAENDAVCLLNQGFTAGDARNDLTYAVFDCYQRYVNAVDGDMGYDTPLLRGLLDKIDALDFIALGCREDREDGTGEVWYDDDSVIPLLRTNVGCAIGDFYGGMTPVWMGLDADTRAPLVMDLAVAFVNPFTRQPQEARAFMNALADSLPDRLLYNLDPSLSEPIRGAQNAQYLEEARAELDSRRAQLKAAEPAQAQQLEDSVAEAERWVEELDRDAWDASEAGIAWYRANAGDVVPAPVNWLYADGNGEAAELLYRYFEGSIGLDEMLREIDRKVQMMRQEGNY